MASSNKLASARSIFEQNIQKNRDAGCDKNILGQKVVKPPHCTRTVSRRLFASQTLSESSSHAKKHHSNNNNNDSCSSTLTNLGNSSHHRHQNKSFRRLSNSSSSSSHNTSNNKDSNNNNNSNSNNSGGEHQPRGQVTVERRSSLELNKRSSSHDKNKTTTTTSTSTSATDKQPTIATSERIHDASLKSNSTCGSNNKRIGSISSLADHLGKLELRSLGRSQHRLLVDDNSSSSSQTSLESHRDRLKLPDFRQSSIAPRRTASNNSHKSGSSSNHTIIMPPGGFPRKVGADTTIPSTTALDDSNQSYDVNQLCSKHTRLDNSSSTNTTHPAGSSSTLGMSHSSVLNNSDAAIDASAMDASSSSCLDDSSSPRIRLKRSTPQRIGRSSSHNDQPPIPTTTTTTTTTRSKSDNMGSSNSSSGSRRSSNHARRESGSTSTTTSSSCAAARNNKARATLSQHFAARGGGPKPSAASSTATWIRPSADVITDDDGSCSNSSEHSKPLKTVPFPTKKTIIKRHSSHQHHAKGHGSSNSGTLSCYSNSNSNSSLDSSSDTLGNSNSSANKVRTVPLRRRSSTSQMAKRPPLAPRPLPPPKPDPEELALMEELEALQKQIETSQGKLGLVQQGEQYDLKRVQETKERKLKRIDATEKTQASTASSSASNKASMTKKEEEELKELYKQAKQTIRQLKQENARIHTQNRKARLEILTTTSTNTLLDESKAETLTSLKELEVFQKQALEEHDHLVQLASMYQKAIMDLEDAIDRKDPQLERVKKMRMLFEDRIDIIVDFMQKKCTDFELVEELTMMAFDEEGWETDDDDDESECETESDHGRSQYQQPKRIVSSSSTTTTTKSSFVSKTPYISRVPNDDDRPLSVEMIPTSSHSLHIFV